MHWAPPKLSSLRVVWALRCNPVQGETYRTVIAFDDLYAWDFLKPFSIFHKAQSSEKYNTFWVFLDCLAFISSFYLMLYLFFFSNKNSLPILIKIQSNWQAMVFPSSSACLMKMTLQYGFVQFTSPFLKTSLLILALLWEIGVSSVYQLA